MSQKQQNQGEQADRTRRILIDDINRTIGEYAGWIRTREGLWLRPGCDEPGELPNYCNDLILTQWLVATASYRLNSLTQMEKEQDTGSYPYPLLLAKSFARAIEYAKSNPISTPSTGNKQFLLTLNWKFPFIHIEKYPA